MRHIPTGLVPFWDDSLFDRAHTDATLSVNRPDRADLVFVCDREWEGDGTDFFTVVPDDGVYRMYYEGWSFAGLKTDGISVCYAESRDGIHWEKPDLGICEFHGSTHNNIILRGISDNITVMKDPNPAEPPERRYKAILQIKDLTGYENTIPDPEKNTALGCMVSSDGIHFEKYAVVSRGFAYDSQNVLVYDVTAGKYFCFLRELHERELPPDAEMKDSPVRAICVTESTDLIHWSDPVRLDFGDREDYPLYTNCVSPYPYDPRYFVGFPSRYVERKEWTANYDRLCGVEARRERMKMNRRYGLALTDCIFMSSSDPARRRWYRFDEACLLPGIETRHNWVYGDCYPAVGGLIETPSPFEGEPPELSLFVDRNHWMSDVPVDLVRYVYRRDGFASVKGDYAGKTLRTVPFTFDGEELKLNFRTSARGSVVLSVLDEKGEPIPGYTTCPLFGDSVERTVDFDAPLSALAGRAVSFKFTIRDAEIFALRFL